jgi:ABC-2 type transport system permease protein
MVLPVTELPGLFATLAALLPAAALADLFRIALGSGEADLPRSLVVLAAWGIGAVGLAARSFRWD